MFHLFIYVVVQFYLWFNFCFPFFSTRYVTSKYRVFSIKCWTLIKRQPHLNAGSKQLIFKEMLETFVRGPGVYLRRANKYRFSLEKHCYDTSFTVYTAFVILINA